MELVAIGGLPESTRMAGGTERTVTPAGPSAPVGPPEPPPPGLHAPAEPSLPPPWALSGPGAVAELLTRDRAVFAAAHVAYHAAVSGGDDVPTRRLAL